MHSAQRQFLVSIDKLGNHVQDYWATKSGGGVTAEASKVFDGGKLVPAVITAPPEVDDVTCTRPYDPLRDQPVIQRLKKLVGQFRTTITVQPAESDLTASRVPPDVYPDAVLVGLTPPEVDAGSGDGATYELVFAVGSIA